MNAPRCKGRLPAALGLAAGLLALGVSACGPRDAGPQQPYREPVRVVQAESRELRPSLESFGTIVYLNKADVFPTTTGVIEELAAEEGMRVRKGQVLALLSTDKLAVSREQFLAEVQSRQAQLSLAEEKLREGRKAVEARILTIAKAEAELAQRQAEFENLSLVYANKRRLHEAGGIADGELEGVRTRYVAAETRLAQAESDLRIQMIGFREEDIRAAGLEPPAAARERHEALVDINTRMLAAERAVAEAQLNASLSELRRVEMALSETAVRAPIDGIVGARLLDLGESASPQTLLFTLFNIDTVFAQLEVSEADLGRVEVGQQAEVYPDARQDTPASGTVALISPYVNPNSRTARVRVSLANPAGRLLPGMFVRVRLFLGAPEQQVVVPAGALLVDPEENAAVFVLRGGRLFRKAVTTGQKQDGWVAVHRGLEPGESVVVEPSASFRDGLEVEVLR